MRVENARVICCSDMDIFFSKPEVLRNMVFGIEDSLVSTVGLVSGIAAAGVSRDAIIMTGVVLILVEAFSMAVGSLVSENSVEEVQLHREVSYSSSTLGAVVMFVSYVLSGVVIIVPYMLVPVATAFWVSVGIALVVLFALGIASGRLAGIPPLHKGVSMVLIGGAAVLLGVFVGSFFK